MFTLADAYVQQAEASTDTAERDLSEYGVTFPEVVSVATQDMHFYLEARSDQLDEGEAIEVSLEEMWVQAFTAGLICMARYQRERGKK